jgi:hypothetical protein
MEKSEEHYFEQKQPKTKVYILDRAKIKTVFAWDGGCGLC